MPIEIESGRSLNDHDQLILSKKSNYQTIAIKIEKPQTQHPTTNGTGTSSVTNVLWNFLNITVGIGILSLPYAMLTTGLVSTVISLIIFGFICAYTLNLLVISAQKVSVFNYEQLAEHCYGSLGYVIASFFIFVMVYGGLITELIAIGDASFKIIQIWGYDSQYQRMCIMLTISTILVLPMCLFRDLSKLEHISAIKVVSIVFIIAVVIWQWLSMTHNPQIMSSPMDMNSITILNINGLPKTLGIIAFSFLCHDCVFLMYNTLENPTLARWKKVSSFGITGTISLNLLFSVPAFLTFGSQSDSNVINNYSITSPLFIAVRIVIILIMALSYPPAFFLVRHIVYSSAQRVYASFKSFRSSISTTSPRSIMAHHSEINTRAIQEAVADKDVFYTVQNAPLSHHICFTLVVFFSNAGIALFIDNLGTAMSLIGSISSMNLELVLPALFYMKICIEDESMFDPQIWKQSTLSNKLYLIVTGGLLLPLIVALLGVLLAVTGVLSSVNMF